MHSKMLSMTAVVGSLFLSIVAGWAGTEESKVVAQPSPTPAEPWEIKVAGPGWLANASGFTGFRGVNSYSNVGFSQILKHINFVYSLGAEVRSGRFGALGGLEYFDAQAGFDGTGLVSRVGLGSQSFLGEFFLSYRVLEAPCGWLELLAGFRDTYLGTQLGLNANEPAIDTASTELVNLFTKQLTTPGSQVQTLVQQQIVNRLSSLEGRAPPLPVPPLAGNQPGQIGALIKALLQSQQPELQAAVRAGAQARVNQLKAELANRVANVLTSHLNTSSSFYDNWLDPLIGLRGRLNLRKAFYLIAETDIGGFGIGSDIAWQGYAGLGCQLTRNIYSEVGFQALYDDFRDESANGFFYQVWLYGARITLGLNF